MAELFQTEARELTGSANTRRLRRAGKVPAILYGQGKDVVHLSIPEAQVNSAIRNNQPYIQLEGEVTESAQDSINQVLRTTTAVVPAMNIPNALMADISSLANGDSITLGDLELPEGVSLLSDPSTVVLTCGTVEAPAAPASEESTDDNTADDEQSSDDSATDEDAAGEAADKEGSDNE